MSHWWGDPLNPRIKFTPAVQGHLNQELLLFSEYDKLKFLKARITMLTLSGRHEREKRSQNNKQIFITQELGIWQFKVRTTYYTIYQDLD